jgi:HD-like signal output (HDOD) protein
VQNALLNIPPFPPVAMRLVQLLNNEEVTNRSLGEALKADPVFSGEILSYANSPLYGCSPVIKSLPHAILVIGHVQLRSLALTVATRRYLKGVLILDELRAFWRYTLACAKISERIAAFYGLPADNAYCAALFHDIGRLGLMAAYPDEYANLIRIAKTKLSKGEELNMSELERFSFGLDRQEAGVLLADRWGLPMEFRATVGRFSDAMTQKMQDMVVVVRTACRLALSLGFGILGNPENLDYQTVLQEVPQHAGVSLPKDPMKCAAVLEEHIRTFDTDRLAVLEEMTPRQPSSGEAGNRKPSTGSSDDVPPGWRTIGWREVLAFVVATAFFTACFFGLVKNLRP